MLIGGRLVERSHRSRRTPRTPHTLLGQASGPWIDSALEERTGSCHQLACVGKANTGPGAENQPLSAALPVVTEDPRLRAGRLNSNLQSGTSVIGDLVASRGNLETLYC